MQITKGIKIEHVQVDLALNQMVIQKQVKNNIERKITLKGEFTEGSA